MLKNLKKNIDLKLLGILVLVYTLISVVSFLKTFYLKSNGYIFQSLDWKTIIIKGYGYDWLLFLIFTTFAVFITKRMIDKKRSWKLILVVHLFLSLFFIVFLYAGSLSLSIITGDFELSSIYQKQTLTNLIRVADMNFIVYLIVVSTIYAYSYLNKEKQIQIQALKLTSQLTDAKMKALKSQLQPHFLFNTLNSIHSLMDSDKEKSQNMLLDLSELLREIVNHKEENLIQLQDEITLLNKYLDIIKVRFSDDINIELRVHKNLEFAKIPAMLLQPIVENSIKHGYSINHTNLEIQISIFKEINDLIIIIQNNGKELEEPLSTLQNKGFGIKNTIERLKTLYNDNYSFDFYNNELGVSTKIKIPFRQAEAELFENFEPKIVKLNNTL